VNPIYRELVLSRIRGAVAAAKAVGGVEHPGLKGQLREIVIRDLLRPLFPADVGLGTGVVISASGKASTQQDVVIYDKSILPPITFEQSTGVFPVEAVLYTVEVKSTLTAAELKKSHDSAAQLVDFDYVAGEYKKDATTGIDLKVDHRIEKAISTLLAFDTDLTGAGKSEHSRYDEIRASSAPALMALCVAGASYCYWDATNRRWTPGKTEEYQYQELVGFLAGIMNTYRRVASTRKEPRLGHYLF
jgi:hypothetical protein